MGCILGGWWIPWIEAMNDEQENIRALIRVVCMTRVICIFWTLNFVRQRDGVVDLKRPELQHRRSRSTHAYA